MYEYEIFKEKLSAMLNAAGMPEYLTCGEKLYTVVSRLEECGKKFNLTAITEPDEVMKKHLLDCLFMAKTVEKLNAKTLIDIGSGAGFPSLPVSSALKDLSVTALDSTQKKVDYMNETAAIAGIGNFHAVGSRAEEFVSTCRETYDIACARAVASLPVLCELCIPYVKVGGYFVAMKGSAAEDEMREAARGVAKLGCDNGTLIPYSIPFAEDKRFLIIYRKNSPTPEQYPRNFSQISKKPL